MSNQTLSVIVPNYNDSDHVAFSIEAICTQSRPPDELIVIDDGSTDNSIEVIQEALAKFPFAQLIRNDTNQGIIQATNRALTLVTSDYLYVGSANDFILPDFFQKSMELLEKHPQAALCCSDCLSINVVSGGQTQISVTGWLPSSGYLTPEQLAEIMRKGRTYYHPITNTVIHKRSLLPKDQIWDPQPGVNCYCDWLLNQVLVFRHGCCYIPEPLVALRWTGSSMSYNVNNTPTLYRKIIITLLRILGSDGYEDVTSLITYSRSFNAFRLSAFTPATLWEAWNKIEIPNSEAKRMFLYLLVEFIKHIVFFIPNVCIQFTNVESRDHAYWYYVHPAIQPVDDAAVSAIWRLRNLWDRIFARSFHEYDKLRSRFLAE